MGRSHGSRENGEKSTTRSVRKGYAEIDSTNLGATRDEWKRPETTFLNHSLRCCSYNTIQYKRLFILLLYSSVLLRVPLTSSLAASTALATLPVHPRQTLTFHLPPLSPALSFSSRL